jgi:O-antigen/teichoic acid export membrane protein
MNNKKHKFLFDIAWYFVGGIIPILVGFIRVPIFTRYFTASEYGIYGIILITYTILTLFLFSWLANCIWRFYNKYKNKNELPRLYSNLFLLFIAFSALFTIIAVGWSIGSNEEETKRLVLYVFLQLMVSNLNNYMLIVHRLEENSGLFNTVTMLRAILSFGLQYILTFRLGWRIEAIPSSMIIVEAIISLFLISKFLQTGKIKIGLISKTTLKELFEYAIPGIISNLGLYLLTSSDRYVIALFEEMDKVGIYNQVYNLCQISIMALVNIYLSVINPRFFKELESNFNATSRLTIIYIKPFLLILAPIVTYFSLFARPVATVLLGPEFRVGYPLIPWVSFAVFIYGLTLFFENRLKLNSKYKPVIIGFLICAAINIGINFFTIPKWGYFWAGISTFISYLILLIYLIYQDIRKNGLLLKLPANILPAFAFLILQSFIYTRYIESYSQDNFTLLTLLTATVFTITYFIIVVIFNIKDLRIFQHIQNQ